MQEMKKNNLVEVSTEQQNKTVKDCENHTVLHERPNLKHGTAPQW